MLEFPRMRQFYLLYIKRFFDFSLALLSVLLLLPLILIILICLYIDSPGPVIFVQKRLGVKGRIFNVYKLRTMIDRPRTTDREIVGRDSELTRLGFWLRRFKIDELPQLINIIKGDMSFIGPRPAMPDRLSEYDDFTKKRLDVRPGLSGLAQVHGNIYLSWPERWQYDVQYVEKVSLGMDISIFFRTIAVLLFGEHRFLRKPTDMGRE